MLKPVWTYLRRFARDTSATVAVEVAIMLPALMWTFGATLVIFNGFEQKSRIQRAAYTISDMLSRESALIDADIINGSKELFDFLAQSDTRTSIRVSSIQYIAQGDDYRVNWSDERGRHFNRLPVGKINSLRAKLPVMANMETVILVETHSVFEPVFSIGIGDTDIETFVFTRPRFVPRMAFDDIEGSSDDDDDDDDDDNSGGSSGGSGGSSGGGNGGGNGGGWGYGRGGWGGFGW